MKNTLPIIFIAVTVGLFYLYISPEYKKINAFQLERDNYDEILDKSVELRQVRSELELKKSKFSEDDLKRLEKMIPVEMDLMKLISEIDNLALKHGIVVHDIGSSVVEDSEKNKQPSASTQAVNTSSQNPGQDMVQNTQTNPLRQYKTLALTFKFKTDYSNLDSFLKEIEKSLRIMDIVSVKLGSNKDNTSLQDYEITLNTYYLK